MNGIRQHDIIKICYLYYNEKKTQEEIGSLLGLSRFKISRVLKKAIEDRVVTIKVNGPDGNLAETEVDLAKRFGLKEAIVVRSLDLNPAAVMEQVAGAGARYLNRIIENYQVLGVTWGRTLRQMIHNIDSVGTDNLTVVQLSGGMGTIEETDANILTMMLSQKLHARPYLLQSPVVVRDRQTKQALLKEKNLDQTLAIARTADLSLVGIGRIYQDGLLWQSGLLEEQDYHVLKEAGAVGAICGRCFDIDGNPCITDWDDRVIGLSLDELKQIKHKIGIAFGEDKLNSITGALRGHYLDVLITDETIAHLLLNSS
jgi:DNA-binding transcriptional regulator LsrR (DeoR family)